MTNLFFKCSLFFIMISLVFSDCATLCSNCAPDGVTCEVCRKGYKLNDKGNCSLPNTAGIIAGAVIGGAILFTAVIIFLCVCINGWKRVFRYPYPYTFDQNGQIISADIKQLQTQQQLNQVISDPVLANFQPRSILRNGASINPTMTFANQQTQLNLSKKIKPNAGQLCIVCMGSNCNVLSLPCNHQFHYGCLSNWFNKNPICPKCQSNVSEVKVQCNACGYYNDSVSFCPPGCPNPKHQQCFISLNKERLTCKNCNKFRRSSRLSLAKSVRGNRASNATAASHLMRSTNSINNFPTSNHILSRSTIPSNNNIVILR